MRSMDISANRIFLTIYDEPHSQIVELFNMKPKVLVDNLKGPVDGLKIHDANDQSGSNACSLNNGGCQHLCLPSGFKNFKCQCSVGYDLQSDGNSCELTEIQDSILFTSYYGLQNVSREKPLQTWLLRPISKMEQPMSFEFYRQKSLVFWISPSRTEIYKMKMDGTEKKVILNDLQSAQKVALDWVSERIYWSDSKTQVIESSDFNGEKRYILIAGHMDEPHAIGLDLMVRSTLISSNSVFKFTTYFPTNFRMD